MSEKDIYVSQLEDKILFLSSALSKIRTVLIEPEKDRTSKLSRIIEIAKIVNMASANIPTVTIPKPKEESKYSHNQCTNNDCRWQGQRRDTVYKDFVDLQNAYPKCGANTVEMFAESIRKLDNTRPIKPTVESTTRVKCTNIVCGWIGKDEETILGANELTRGKCPKCDNKTEFYDYQPSDYYVECRNVDCPWEGLLSRTITIPTGKGYPEYKDRCPVCKGEIDFQQDRHETAGE